MWTLVSSDLWRNQVSLQLVAKACRVPLGFINYRYDYDYANVALFFGWGDIFDGENDITSLMEGCYLKDYQGEG